MTAISTGQPILRVEGLSKTFELHHLHRSINGFHDVNFELAPGEFLLVSGPNGAGKSTLLRTLFRSYLAQGGSAIYRSELGEIDLVRAADTDIVWLRRHEIGFVTQFLSARPRVSAEEVVAEPLVQRGTPRPEALERGREWLDRFGLKPDLWPAYPSTFSGGEQQKVNLARAFITPRRLLLLDEPTASLDVKARAALVERIASLKQDGTAVLAVFHHPEEIRHLVDRELQIVPADATA